MCFSKLLKLRTDLNWCPFRNRRQEITADTQLATTEQLFPSFLISWRKVIKTKILSLAFIGKEVKLECQRPEVRSSHIFLAVRDWLLEAVHILKDYVQTVAYYGLQHWSAVVWSTSAYIHSRPPSKNWCWLLWTLGQQAKDPSTDSKWDKTILVWELVSNLGVCVDN